MLPLKCLAPFLLCAAMPSLAHAAAILQVTSGTGTATDFFGESFTTPSGGPWNNITFNFFSDTAATTPAASGQAFLLTQEYLGTPAALSSSTAGFLAQSESISGGVYFFNIGVTLNPSTEYWLYENALMTTSGNGSGGSLAAQAYFATTAGEPFAPGAISPQLANFRLNGTQVPEPSTFVLASCFFILILMARRRFQHSN